ncbi:discoidin domain-containing protein [Paenibacillus sp. S150]|uniref:discoidin domain-containing protein n=1 Tax=Paenibacillus sp. S150 TaxID=2749826 RepID=UPI001C59E59E|nr:discoidin domain-containing protein [Paenibacillus sp. S150]MBW4084434.1 discoidin domain-containing protein [Paenibacillus sp. S150]
MSKLSAASDAGPELPEGTVLWQLGQQDGSAAEFAETGSPDVEEVFNVASSTIKASALHTIPSGLRGDTNPELRITYELDEIPVNGVLFRVSILDAYKSVPQMSVFSNRQLSGIIQIAGVAGTDSKYNFRKTYELYIPKEQLVTGTNELKLQAARGIYSSDMEDKYNWWTWDNLSLEALKTPIKEPIHGSYTLTGTMVNNKQFYFDEGAVTHLPYIMKWLGLAYSGNIMRTSCASDVGRSCSNMGDYYKVLKDYNMQAVALYLYTGDIKLKEDGSLPEDAEKKLNDYFEQYGPYFQYYEVDNEPGLFNRSKAVNLAIADWLNEKGKTLAPHLQTVAPGWAYWPDYSMDSCGNQKGAVRQCGDPDGWERDPEQRKELEEVTDLTNGHSYGESYIFSNGGSFTENLKTFAGAADGLGKKMLTTEFGTSDSHVDAYQYGAAERTAAVFDRIMRAHIGYADMFVQHAAFFKNFSLFKYGFNLEEHDPAKTEIYYTKEGEDSRVSIMRRLDLAYATHGAPLSYEITNKDALADKLVYVRAVDTSTLEPLAGSGATSNKVLVNFVNFEETPQTVTVKVTMPEQTVYEGERFGKGDTYEEARSYVSGKKAAPALEFTETLAPGEAVQYILESSSEVADAPPQGFKAAAVKGLSVKLNWLEAPGASYEVLRAEGSGGDLKVVADGIKTTEYTDGKLQEGTLYTYAVRVAGSGVMSEKLQITATGLVPLDRSDWKVSSNVNTEASNPANAIDGDRRTRWDTGKHQASGEYFQIDLGKAHSVEAVDLDYTLSSYDYPRGYELYISDDAQNWTRIASGKGQLEMTKIVFSQVKTRYIRILQTGSGGNYWSIQELQVYSRE